MTRQFFAVLLLGMFIAPVQGQTSEVEHRLLLRRAELNLREIESVLAQKKKLFEQGLTSRADLEKSEAEHERAQIDFQMAQVALTNELPSFRILSAVKSVDPAGTMSVRIALEPQRASLFAASTSRSYLVSILDDGTIVGDPYQQRVTITPSSGVQTITYKLLRDVDRVSVMILSGSKREEIRLVLERDSNSVLRVSCDDCAQEGALGAKVSYHLRMERFDTEDRTFRVEYRGIPPGFTAEVVDPETHASLTAIRFPQTVAAKQMLLDVYLPASADGSLIGTVIPIEVVLFSAEIPTAAPLSVLKLQLRLRGAPRLVLTSDNLLIGASRGRSSATTLIVRNLGGAVASDVMFDFEAPAGILLTVEPHLIRTVKPQETVVARVTALPSEDAVPGDYSVAIRAKSRDRAFAAESADITYRISVSRRVGLQWIAWAALLVVLSGGGAVVLLRKPTS